MASRIVDVLFVGGAAVGVYLLWQLNANRLASLYDYSIPAYVNSYLAAGLAPYKDFVTPIQPLTYYYCYACEMFFGRDFRSLAYGNLALTFGLLFVAARLATPAFGRRLALLFALAVCVASTLQHGIPWYNAFGFVLFAAVCHGAFGLLARRRLQPWTLAWLAIALLFTGMTKLNYAAAGVAVVLYCLGAWWLDGGPRGKLLVAAAGLTVCALVLPAAAEMIVTGADLRSWLWNVIQLPARRSHRLAMLWSGDFWFGVVYGYYRPEPFRAAFAISAAAFAIIAAAIRPGTDQRRDRRAATLAFLGLALFFCISVVLAVTNVDMVSIALAVLPVALLSVLRGFGDRLAAASRRSLSFGAVVFSAWLFLAGFFAAASHSRLVYGDTPTYPHFTVVRSPGKYLNGVAVTDDTNEKIQNAGALLRQYGVPEGSPVVYWGPGLEILARQFGTPPHKGFPAFYNPLTAWEADSPAIISLLEQSPIRIVISDAYWNSCMQGGVRAYLEKQWTERKAGRLICYIRGR